MRKILIVEDMQEINHMLLHCLEKDGYECVQAFSGSEAKLLLELQSFDLVLLDLMLPGVTGEQVLVIIKEKFKIPVIIISAKDNIETKVEVLELGADDYICKPFDLNEVLARVHVQLRKVNPSFQKTIKIDDIELNIASYQIKLKEHEISLTKHEFLIIKLFMQSVSQVFTKQQIYEYAWGEEYLGDERIINTHIGNIRAKFRKYSEKEYILKQFGELVSNLQMSKSCHFLVICLLDS